MDSSLYYVLFVVLFAIVGAIALTSTSGFKRLVPFIFIVFVVVVYFCISNLLGSPKPVNGVLGQINLSADGGIVVGGDLQDEFTFLLVKDKSTGVITFYKIPYNKHFADQMQQAMQAHANNNSGEQWGFELKPAKDSQSDRKDSQTSKNKSNSQDSDKSLPNPVIETAGQQPLVKNPYAGQTTIYNLQ